MTTDLPSHRELDELLRRFEAELEVPIVPGELPEWLESTRQAFSELQGPLKAHLEQQPSLLDQIEQDDPNLASRVDPLRETNRRVLGDLEALGPWIDRLVRQAEQTEPREELLDHAVQELVDRSLVWILEVRKLQSAVNTWSTEAQQRDRGTLD
jgi:hypothetical protein